ncbi:unnamed protein product [Urochloa decumbens]|uniref:TF-B3 domain-containing protein n=1 Tax=Urochloa decumbens TaxID=240449 RepID=A0ABC8YJ21_9POAL
MLGDARGAREGDASARREARPGTGMHARERRRERRNRWDSKRLPDILCEVCGNIGYKRLLVCCRDCKCSAVHLYCLDKVIFDASLAEWWCYECLERGVTCSRSLERESNERSPSHAHFGSTVHEQATKGVESATNTGLRRKGKAEDIPSAKNSSESDDLQESSRAPKADYVLSYRSYLSEAQKERVMAFIQEIQPKITVFVAVMQKRNVQPPGPFLGISKEYALPHFPHKSSNVILQTPSKSNKWHLKFYKRNASRKNMLMGQWLDFVRDNHVQEGDICLLFPTAGGRRYTFTVYLLCASATHSIGRAGFQMVCPCPGRSSTKMASEVHIMEESINGEHISLETGMHEISDESLEFEDSGGLSQPPYIVPSRNSLSKPQKKIVEERVRAIKSKLPICVAVMKNNNVGDAQKWMLELCVRYAAVHLPASGQTVTLQCMGKTWIAQMVIHNGRRWFLNGGWAKFARDNGLQVGDICLFELKDKRKLTMKVHIISREQFSLK